MPKERQFPMCWFQNSPNCDRFLGYGNVVREAGSALTPGSARLSLVK